MKIKLLSLVIFLGFLLSNGNAQTTQQEINLIKYWHYRDRLQYFIIPGLGPGKSQVSVARNLYSNAVGASWIINYGQQSIHMGMYMGVLATEFAKLQSNNEDVNATLYEIYCVLHSFIENMDKCENSSPWNKPNSSFDGFFMRNNVPLSFLNDNFHALNKNVENVYEQPLNTLGLATGKPFLSSVQNTDTPGSMSQDEAIGLLVGLALIKKCLGSHPNDIYSIYDENGNFLANENLGNTASTIAGKIILRIYNFGSWKIIDPNGDFIPDSEGGNAIAYAYGFRKAAEYFLPSLITNTIHYSPFQKTIWQLLASGWTTQEDCDASSNRHMQAALGAIGNSLSNIWMTPAQGIYNNTQYDDWDAFYLLLRKVLHNSNNTLIHYNEAEDQINSAPCDGPFCHVVASYMALKGWASTLRYTQCNDIQRDGDKACEGNYNGLDFMLIYNLYCIAQSTNGYINYLNRNLQGYLPIRTGNYIIGSSSHHLRINSLKTIKSTQIIGNNTLPIPSTPADPGWVEYRAGETITLKPGFHANNGVYFHAFIQPFECTLEDDQVMMKQINENELNFFNSYDSLLSINQSPFEEIEENNVEENSISMDSTSFDLQENVLAFNAYPNPCSENVNLEYFLPYSSNVQIIITNVYGEQIKVVRNDNQKAGVNQLNIDCKDFCSGVYYCMLITEKEKETIKIIIAK